MTIPFPTFGLRLAPSGPFIQGTNDGDIIEWDAATEKWRIGAGGGGAGATEFDHLISTRADLAAVVAPVGGEFILPSGSYFFKEEVDLDDGERIAVDGETVFMMGGGPQSGLLRGFNGNFASSEPALVCRNGARVRLWNMRIGAAQIARHGVLVTDSTIEFEGCQIPSSTGGSQPALELGTGSTCLARDTAFGGAVAGVEITDGSHEFINCSLRAGLSGDGCNITLGAVDERIHFHNCYFEGSAAGGQALDCTGAQLDVFLVDCEFECNQPGASGVVFGAMSSIQVLGGIIFGTSGAAGDGIQLNGDIAGGAQFLGLQGEFLDDFIIRTAGTQNRVVIADCDTAGDVAVGVDWAAANIPTNGLLEHGNQFNTLTPFQNHTSASARVNRKCNSLQGGLSTETAIVP